MKILALAVTLSISGFVYAQDKPETPKPVASEMSRKDRDAYLAARYGDPMGIDRPALTMKDAAKQPLMLVMGGLLFGSAAADAAGQGACSAVHNCSEHNPLMGHSAGQRWSVTMGSTAIVYLCDLWLKKHGHGTTAMAITSIAVTGHTVEAVAGFRDAGVR